MVERRRGNKREVACVSANDRVQDEPVGVTAEWDRGVFQADQKGPRSLLHSLLMLRSGFQECLICIGGTVDRIWDLEFEVANNFGGCVRR